MNKLLFFVVLILMGTAQISARSEAKVKGECGRWQGESDSSCRQGKFHPHPPDTTREHLWTCRNIPHDGEIQCKEFKSGDSTSNQTSSVCSPDQKLPHWKEIKGKCLPSCGLAKNIYCKKNACRGKIDIISNEAECKRLQTSNIGVLQLFSYETCCLVLQGSEGPITIEED